MSAIGLTACGSDISTTEEARTLLVSLCNANPASCTELYGTATVDGPVAQARVNIFAPDGKMLATTTTNESGGFSVRVPETVVDYSVVVFGGTYKSNVLKGSLRAEVRNRPLTGQQVTVNPVSTLVAERVITKPGTSVAQATAEVMKFLAIPKAYGIGINLTPEQFSGQVFARMIGVQGSMDELITTLLTELNAGKTHTFKLHLLQSNGGIEVASFIAKGIASGVLGEVGSEGFTSIMSSLGLGFGGGSSDDSSAKAAAEAARQQAAKLAEIADAVNALSSKLDLVQDTILVAVSKSAYTAALNGKVSDLTAVNSFVDSELRALTITPDKDRQARLKDYILKNLVQGGMQSWHNALYGTVSRDSSLIVLWSKVVQQVNPGIYDFAMADAVQSQWDYLDAEQARAIAYIIDYMRSEPAYVNDIIPTIESWRQNRKLQMSILRGTSHMSDNFYYPEDSLVKFENVILKALPNNTVVDRTTRTIWYKELQPLRNNAPVQREDFQAMLNDFRSIAGRLSGIDGGWDLPPTRETLPHKAGDLGHFDGLARLDVKVPTNCVLFLGETIDQRAEYIYKKDFDIKQHNPQTDYAYYDAIHSQFAFRMDVSKEPLNYMPVAVNSKGDYTFYRYKSVWDVSFVNYTNYLSATYVRNDQALKPIYQPYEDFSPCFFLTRPVEVDLWYQ